jgi:uncharacterized pyridoxal phosphate-dependent enzyme
MGSTRRTILQTLGISMWGGAAGKSATLPTQGVLKELGIRPVINCRGTHTVIGASKEWPELHDAMREASKHFIVVDELQDKVGERLSKLMGTEAAMVTTGAAGAIQLGTCAALTGGAPDKARQLPDLTGMKSEVIIQKVHRNGYDHAVRNTGATIIDVENREQFENAISERTAMMYYLGGTSGDSETETPVPLEQCLEISRKAGFPVMVDAANMLPPWGNLQKLAALKTDMICVSGGKHMRGPQCSGILAGRADLVKAARRNASPFSDTLGRPLKVGREEIVGIWIAAEKYSKLDFDALDRENQAQAEYLAREFKKILGLQVSFAPHDRTRRVHRLIVDWNEESMRMTRDEMERQLMEGEPRIAVLRQKKALLFTMFMNDPGDEKIVARRVREIFAVVKSA